MSRPLRIVPVRPGDETTLAKALAAALDGSGPPVVPVDAGAGPHAAHPIVGGSDTSRAAAEPDVQPVAVEPDFECAAAEPDVELVAELTAVVTTSGSTGRPRAVALSRAALVTSATATHDRLGGPGQWLLALPTHHIAGLQVLTRSLVAGTDPVVLDRAASFTPGRFAAATQQLTGARRYTSLVPTQLHRALTDPEGRAALLTYDAVLVGGAATPRALLHDASDAGVSIVRTYGMTETAGGCVYEGQPLDDVQVRLDDDGRIHVAGPVLASGYLGEPELTRRTFFEEEGTRWLRTDDLGVLDAGSLRVLGRLDDVITTGGVKIAPAPVEAALVELPEIAQACVVGVPDAEWGAMVVAVVALAPGARAPTLGAVRDHVAPTLGRRAAPRRLVVVPGIPTRGPGKPDRRAVARLAAGAERDGRG